MINHVQDYPLSTILPANGQRIYKIPKYQREYTWGKYNWSVLFDDLVENDEGYFLGSYICVSKSGLSNCLELIDGQQRFTSLSLLLLAIYFKLLNYQDEFDEEEKHDFWNIKNQLTYKVTKRDPSGAKQTKFLPRLELQIQNSNNNDYNYLLSQFQMSSPTSKPSNFGLRRINKGYKFFIKCIEDYIRDRQEEDSTLVEIDLLFSLAEKINSSIMVGIEVDTHKDAYMLFESLNHRGVPLSAIDLIKNTLISSSEADEATDWCYDLWQNSLLNVGEDYSVQERFFRHYYNSFRMELNEPFTKESNKQFPLGYLATRTTLIDIYEKLIKNDYKNFIEDLHDKSLLYSLIVNKSDEVKCYSDEFLNLERIAGAPSYMLLLYLLSYQSGLQISDKDIENVAKLLIRFFVRRNLTDIPGTRNLNKIFMDCIDHIRNKSGSEILETIKNDLISVSAPEDMFIEKLNGPIYLDNPDATRFLLCFLEDEHKTREIQTDLWARNRSNVYIWTIEHIFPEGLNIPKEWVDMIADGDQDKATLYQQQYVHNLGNLTLSGYNSKLSNMSFDRKKNRKSKDGKKYIGYKNGLFLNEDVVDKDKWTIDEIRARTEKIVNIISDMFKW